MAVGDELLLGQTVDTNSAWLSRASAAMGIEVVRRYTVPDRDEAIGDAVTLALEHADVVFTSGGLGPTPDDRTVEALASRFGMGLTLDPELVEGLEARFRARGYDHLPESNLSQARVPDGAQVLGNPLGTAPALALERPGGVVIVLPGVPRELREIHRALVSPWLEQRFAHRLTPLLHREIHTTGIPESDLATRLKGLDQDPDVRLSFLPSGRGVTLRLVTPAGPDPDRARSSLDRVEARLAPVVEPFRFEAESGDLVEAVARTLVATGRTVATAESCTGGGVAKRLTDRPGSSAWFVGALVAYANEAKVRHLGVAPATLEAVGAVSREVAEAMALGAAERFDAACGIGVTGVAGPDGGTDEKPVGTVWYAASVDARVVARQERFPGDRSFVRVRSGQAALMLLLRMLEERA